MPHEFSRTPPSPISLLSLQEQVYALFLCLEAQGPISLSVLAWLQQLQVVKLLGEPCPALHKRQDLGICVLESFSRLCLPPWAIHLCLSLAVSPVSKCL